MGLIRAAADAVGGTLADQWKDFFTAPVFDEQTIVAPATFQQGNWGRGINRNGSSNVITDGSRVVVPENTAVVITDGGGIASVSTEPGYFVYRNDAQPSVFAGSGIAASLVKQSWERFKFGGQPGQQQLIHYVNLREIRGLRFGTPGLLPYKDHSLVPEGTGQAPVLRLRARGQYSIRVVDPVRFFRNFLPANFRHYSLADEAAVAQLRQEFLTAFQAALQSLSRTTDIASIASHGPELASALTNEGGPNGSWLERFGLEVVSAAISAVEYDDESRELMDKYNRGLMLGGSIGNAYTQTTIADAAMSMAENGGTGTDMMGFALGVNSTGAMMSGLTQPTTPPPPPPAATGYAAPADPVAVLGQLKAMLDQGLISAEQYAAKQEEVLGRM
jgi:membrane protease subunit (stomatin/prohibitin family)